MSRHILIPASETGKCHLIAVDGTEKKTIRIPEGIFTPKVFRLVHDTRKLRDLLFKIAKTGIYRSKEGVTCCEGDRLNIQFDNAVVDCCNNVFKEMYEPFYCVLGKYNIVL